MEINQNNEVEVLDTSNLYKKSNKSKILLIILGLLILILLCFFGYYMISLKNPKTIFKMANSYVFDSLDSFVDIDYDFDESLSLNGKVKFTTTIPNYAYLSKEEINYNVGMDLLNEKASFEVGLTENGSNVINLTSEVKDNNVYLFLDKLYEKTIIIDNNTLRENMEISVDEIFKNVKKVLNNKNIEDAEYILEEFEVMINNALNKAQYEKGKETIKINNKSINTIVFSLTFNKENIQTIFNSLINDILNNKVLLEKLISYTDLTELEFREELNNIKSNLVDLEEITDTLKLKIYTNGLLSKLVKISLVSEDEEISFITYDKYMRLSLIDFFVEINEKELKVINEDEVIITGTVNKLSEDFIDITFKSTDKEFAFNGNLKYTNGDDKNKLVLEFNISEMIKINLVNNFEKINDKKSTTSYNLEIEYNGENIGISGENTVLVGKNIADSNITNSINYNKLSDDDFNKILTNFEDIISKTNLNNLFDSSAYNTFVTDTNSIISASKDAMSLKMIGSITDNYKEEGANSVCFTVENLYNLGLLDNEYMKYQGTITVMKVGVEYLYRTEIYDNNYYVKKYTDSITEDDVYDLDMGVLDTLKTEC